MSRSSSSSPCSSPVPSGSSTPLSDVSFFLQTLLLPTTFVLLEGSSLDSGRLGSLFRKHGGTESMGLVVEVDSSVKLTGDTWSSADHDGVVYHTSSHFSPSIDWVSLTPTVALPYLTLLLPVHSIYFDEGRECSPPEHHRNRWPSPHPRCPPPRLTNTLCPRTALLYLPAPLHTSTILASHPVHLGLPG